MSETLLMKRVMGSLRPIDAQGEAALEGVRTDEIVSVEIKRPRNVRFHRKWFAIVSAVFPHQSLYPTVRVLNNAIKAATGLAKTYALPDGRIIIDTESISFAKMDEAEFEQWAERAIDFVLAHILPRVNKDDLRDEVEQILLGSYAGSVRR